jgi:hypothetical protein
MAINIAYVQYTRTQMQITTDASVRAANRIYMQTGDLEQAATVANSVSGLNPVNGHTITINSSHLIPGQASRSSLTARYSFSPAESGTNALKLNLASVPGSTSLLVPIPGSSPIQVNMESIATQMELDIALVIDRSGSMAYADYEIAQYPPAPHAAPAGWNFGDACPLPSRWFDTRDAVNLFLYQLLQTPMQEKVAMITYSDNATIDRSLTSKYNEVLNSMKTYSDHFSAGGTNISSGMTQAVNHLNASARPWAAKVILLMTDGHYNIGSDPVATAQSAADAGIMVFTVSFSDEANQSKMAAVAAAGGGRYFHAATGSDLAAIFEMVADEMPSLICK